ncbi:MAG TPA: hypothetical protein VJQ52_12180 [Steroidobacteraceae bacterium]|nr:hypothetical protein [Steroidobacteraceae bacterium]
MFDSEECFHLALHASASGQPHTCMTYLRQLLQEQPTHAPAMYLLAAQHAEIGLYERAVDGFKAALAIAPNMEIARFQLGLLLLDGNRRAEARENLAALSGSSDPGLATFAAAMVALAEEDLQAAREKLTLGLTQSRNPPIAALMQRVLAGLEARGEAAMAEPATGDDGAGVLRAYRQKLS